jgi:hypothetical protein
MFRLISIIAIVAVAILVAQQLRLRSADGVGPSPMRERGRRWQEIIYMAMLVGTLIGALTGIGSVIVSGGPIGGWMLILHCLAAPLFAIGIAAIALLWAGAYMRGSCAAGCAFWLMLISGMVAIFSIAFTMTPLFGTANQHFLLAVHRWSSLALVIFMALHAARVMGARTAGRAGA